MAVTCVFSGVCVICLHVGFVAFLGVHIPSLQLLSTRLERHPCLLRGSVVTIANKVQFSLFLFFFLFFFLSQLTCRFCDFAAGFGGQTKPVFHKKAKTTKKITLRLECERCKYRAQQPIKRTKHFELGEYVDRGRKEGSSLVMILSFVND